MQCRSKSCAMVRRRAQALPPTQRTAAKPHQKKFCIMRNPKQSGGSTLAARRHPPACLPPQHVMSRSIWTAQLTGGNTPAEQRLAQARQPPQGTAAASGRRRRQCAARAHCVSRRPPGAPYRTARHTVPSCKARLASIPGQACVNNMEWQP